MGFIAVHHHPSLTRIASKVVSSRLLPAAAIDLQQLSDSPFSFFASDSGDALSPLVLSCIAGASTSLGALVVFFVPRPSNVGGAGAADDKQSEFLEGFLSFSLSLAASVMITVSVISILPEALKGALEFDPTAGFAILSQEKLLERSWGFGAGCLSYFLLSRVLLVLPEPESILEQQPSSLDVKVPLAAPFTGASAMSSSLVIEEELEAERIRRASSWRMAMLIFISLLLHNAPEGLAVAASASESNELGLIVTIGIMLHNIPEGLAIAVPCLMAQPDRPWLAFGLASISGLAEPLGALVALRWMDSSGGAGDGMPVPLGDLLAAVAGIMCMVSIRDLYPEAQRHILPSNSESGDGMDYSMLWMGTVSGVIIMSATEFLLVPRG